VDNQQKREPQPDDYGTRQDHFQEHLDSLNVCIEALKERSYSQEQKTALIKLTIAAEVMQATIDAFSGLNKDTSEYALYRLLHGIPKNPEEIIGGRGTPLI
jgi:hypothetical protein